MEVITKIIENYSKFNGKRITIVGLRSDVFIEPFLLGEFYFWVDIQQ